MHVDLTRFGTFVGPGFPSDDCRKGRERENDGIISDMGLSEWEDTSEKVRGGGMEDTRIHSLPVRGPREKPLVPLYLSSS